ncbi:MAG: DUF1207 domain-containing protein [Gemmatimonadota bacterium]|nr:DUF1207 domain-containing protein [Gemmatimonadota bacterium]MEC9243125.1 DUF1207 domain-containing protein [Gemmatimonadota bacterium]MED5198353.1 DUF1207 domain-containing protein [Gemmatimonadota bacterium]
MPFVLCFAILGPLSPASAVGQGVARWFPDVEPFPSLIAAPREVQVRASFVLADRPALGYAGRNIEAEVAIGHSLAILRFDDGSRPDRAMTLGLEMGIFSRFFMEVAQKDLINSDFRVGLPWAFRSGSWEARGMIRHFSAHLGDDYLVRFLDDEVVGGFGQTSKDGFEGLLARRLGGGGRLYVGGEYNFHTNENMSRAAFRFGGEWDPVDPGEDNGGWPFFAGDFEYASLSEQLAATLVGGMGLRVNGQQFRLEARARLGFTPMGHFRGTDETFYGLGFSLDL